LLRTRLTPCPDENRTTTCDELRAAADRE
jgi:hypothetical protein